MTSYTDIIEKIETTLESVDKIQKIYAYPLGENEKPEKYPCAVFFPELVDNSMESVKANERTYRFRLVLLIQLNDTNAENIFTSVMPGLVDSTLSAFDTDWQYGEASWAWVDTGEQGITIESEGKVAFFRATINIVVITDI